MSETIHIRHQPEEGSAIETLQSLVVAFVLAMTFRGFVTEGFVIPTGSMAPTLMGQHYLMHSKQTGLTYATEAYGKTGNKGEYDPMLGRQTQLAPADRNNPRQSMGDRILVVKCMYPFFQPKRFDVVVFKNPTNPDGADENFIKRLIGLPNEKLLLVDGDVFTGKPDADINDLVIQRKPEHVQRAVWQPIYNSDYVPLRPGDLDRPYIAPWSGPGWETQGLRSYRCEIPSENTVLQWEGKPLTTTDWTAYDMMRYSVQSIINVSDLRISAAITADQDDLHSTLQIITRGHRFEFILEPTDTARQYQAIVRMTQLDNPSTTVEKVQEVKLPKPGKVFNVEFWHVDQSLSIYIDNKLVVGPLEYDWRPKLRMENSYNDVYEQILSRLPRIPPTPADIRWRFGGSPVTLHRVRLDRDLYYQPARIGSFNHKNANAPEFDELVRRGSWAYATHPEKPAQIGPDQFLMLGDNSAFSSDSRLWGAPDEIVAEHIDPSPFLVNRKLLLGKAWVVYFPATYPLNDGGRNVVPDFGRLRFIR